LEAEGVPATLAQRIAVLSRIVTLADIARLASESGRTLTDVGALYFRAGTRFSLDWLRETAAHLPRGLAWNRLAITALIDEIYDSQARLVAGILKKSSAADVDAAIDSWMAPR